MICRASRIRYFRRPTLVKIDAPISLGVGLL
jgi:hypothetical protein